MGYTIREGTGITDYWPDDDEDTIYRSTEGSISMEEILEIAQEKWPGIDLKDIFVYAMHIHTHCLYYDCYDPGDYTNFIVITRTNS